MLWPLPGIEEAQRLLLPRQRPEIERATPASRTASTGQMHYSPPIYQAGEAARSAGIADGEGSVVSCPSSVAAASTDNGPLTTDKLTTALPATGRRGGGSAG